MRCALLALLLAAAPAAGGPPKAPILRVETGMHTAAISRIDVDAAGRFLVTGSEDKTVRVWDLASGELLRVLRPPVGEGNEGKIYAVAMTPDGELVAAGGWTGYAWGGEHSIYLFDRRTGRLVRTILGLPNVILHLALSPDGSRLAATLGGANGLRIFRTSDGVELFRDAAPKDNSYWAEFDAAGHLVTSSLDGKLRLYGPDHRQLAIREAPGGKRPFGVAFSPDGRQVAVGYEDSTRVDIVSGADLRLLFSADTSGTNNDLSKVAWSADGAFLFAAGRHYAGGSRPIRRWSLSGRGPARDFSGSLSTVMGLRPLADGRLVFGSADPAWGVLAASGESTLDQGPAQADTRGLFDGFRVDRRGERVRFAYEPSGKRPAVFALRERRLVLDPATGDHFEGELLSPRISAPSLEITDWNGTFEPRRNGEALPLDAYETSFSLAIAADGQSFLLGTHWFLRAFRADGTALWSKPTGHGIAWAVNLTPDGSLALAAFADGTIRWYRTRDGVELLAFFPHADGKRWVLWTPSGYYDASVDGEDLIGWHVNRGPDQTADFFSGWQFRDTYRRPDVIDLVLDTLDEAEALRRAGIRAAAPALIPAPPPVKALPPEVTILDPADDSVVSTQTVTLRINVRLPSGAKLDQLRVSVDGLAVIAHEIVSESAEATFDTRDFYEEREILIPQRDCTIEVTAESAGRRSEPARRHLRWAPTSSAQKLLRVLAVGISKYANPDYRLEYADEDATDIAAAWKRLEGRLYERVETRVLTDAQATQRALFEGLQWLGTGLAKEDVAVLFLAGHGINDGGYYFLPHDADTGNKLITLVSDTALRDVLMRLPSQVLLFLDTCRAGSLMQTELAGSDEELRRLVDVRQLMSSMTFSAARVVVFSAAQGGELSQESPDWGHGAFSKALLDGLDGAADTTDDGEITTSELEGYLATTVRRLTRGAQTPVVAKLSVTDLVVAAGRLPPVAPGGLPPVAPGGLPPVTPEGLPPVVTILDPANGSTVSTKTVKLRVNVRSPSGAKVDRLLVSIDGRAVTTRGVDWEPSKANKDVRDFYEEREIPIPQRDCTIEVTAEAAGRRSEPARLKLRWVAPALKPERRAWVLAVGVSKYQRPEYNLGFAAKDAIDLAAAWKALEGSGFSKVETRVLTDADATHDAILEALDWLSAVPADANVDDIIVLFLSGHGVNESGQYYFLPHDADPARRIRTFLSQSQLQGVLNALQNRVVLFLDTGHAGSFAGQYDKERWARVDPTAFVNALVYTANVLVFSATAPRQFSQESPVWGNGAFTKALVEVLGAARREQRQLTASELERYLYEIVSDMTGQAQTPTVAKAGLPDIVLVPGNR